MIEVKNLKKDFGKHGEIKVLRGITETIEKGEKVVIIGPSGSGKSTFLRCLNLLEVPTSGEIWFEGTLINDKKHDINKLRQKLGMVFQHFNLFPHLSIEENICLAPVKLKLQTKDEARENAQKLLRRIGLLDKANAYPSQLSGGTLAAVRVVPFFQVILDLLPPVGGIVDIYIRLTGGRNVRPPQVLSPRTNPLR